MKLITYITIPKENLILIAKRNEPILTKKLAIRIASEILMHTNSINNKTHLLPYRYHHMPDPIFIPIELTNMYTIINLKIILIFQSGEIFTTIKK